MSRQSVYEKILIELGGSGTPEDIYSFGTGIGLISCSMNAVRTALRNGIKNGVFEGNLNDGVRLPWATRDKLKPTTREYIEKYMQRVNHQGGLLLALDAKSDERYNEVFGRLDDLQRQVSQLTAELEALKAEA